MDKKEVYEHLARVYLGNSSDARKNRNGSPNRVSKKVFYVSLGLVFVVSFVIALFLRPGPSGKNVAEINLVLNPAIAKINFRFPPARQEIYSLDLKRTNLSGYKGLAFSIRKFNYKDTISLKIEFTNSYNEKSEIFIRDITGSWKEYKIKLTDFKKISDWSEMSNLSFIAEEWNVREGKDIIYIDNVRLVR